MRTRPRPTKRPSPRPRHNRRGLPPADDLGGPVLSRYRGLFMRGAQIMVGHTTLATYADMPYLGPRAEAIFADRAARNVFFAAVGEGWSITLRRSAGAGNGSCLNPPGLFR